MTDNKDEKSTLPTLNIGAAYIRVSDERQDEYSPDSQLKLIKEYAKKNGYVIPEEFVFYDDGISAKTASKRTQFNNMIALAKKKEFQTIFVWKFSRFARNQEESILYKNLLKKHDVSVISISEPIMDGPFGSLIERIIEWMDEFYLIRLSGEVKRGMTEKASRGGVVCAPPFGYDLIDDVYVQNDDARHVKDIFDAYIGGEGVRSIAVRLGSYGVKTKFGNPPDFRFVEYVLNNPVYIGKIRWSTEGRAASRRDYDNENLMIVDGKHEPIIDSEWWDKAQEVIKRKKKMYSRYQRECQPVQFMLKGLVRCSSCDSTLVYQSHREPRLQCHRYAKGSCNVSHSTSIKKINTAVLQALEFSLNGTEFTIETRKRTKPIIDYQKQINAESRKLDRIKAAYQSGADTLEEYTENKRIIMRTIESYRNAAASIETSESISDIRARVKRVMQYIKDPSVSEDDKNRALRTIISKIVYDKAFERVDIYYNI